MRRSKKAQRILEKIATIQRMERGKICQMGGGNHYNHQTWSEGRNVVRYVRVDDLHELQEAIEGYARFTKLVEQYADEIIRLTRKDRERKGRKKGKT